MSVAEVIKYKSYEVAESAIELVLDHILSSKLVQKLPPDLLLN